MKSTLNSSKHASGSNSHKSMNKESAEEGKLSSKAFQEAEMIGSSSDLATKERPIFSSAASHTQDGEGSRSQTIIKEESNSEYKTFDNTRHQDEEENLEHM